MTSFLARLIVGLGLLLPSVAWAQDTCTYFGGYPWRPKGCLTSTDLNAAMAQALAPPTTLSTVVVQNALTPGGVTLPMLAFTPLLAGNNLSDLNSIATARATLGLGGMALQNPNAVAITGGTITGLGSPAVASDAATKGYVDSSATGLQPNALGADYATAAVLPNSPTYANGTAGVGATLTANVSNSALVVDGQVANTIGKRILVKNQAAPMQNGVYQVTQIADATHPWILTRVTDFDAPSEMAPNTYFFVAAGTGGTNAATGWTSGARPTAVGTDPITFAQFSAAQTYAATGSIQLIGNTFSLVTNPNIGTATGTSLALTDSLNVGPGPISQLGIVASSGWPGPANWNTFTGSQDQIRIVTNNFPLAQEFLGGSTPVVTTLMVGMDVPSNAAVGLGAEQTIAGYIRTNGVQGGAAVSGIGYMGAPGSAVWGLVGNVLNCGTWNCTVGFGGSGTVYGAELDMNLVRKAGSVAPDITAIGLHIVNAGFAAAGGFLHTGINIGTANALVPWPVGINFAPGGAAIALNIGQVATGNNQPSQTLQFNSITSGGVVKTASLQELTGGDLQLLLPAGNSLRVPGLAPFQAANGADTIFGTRFTDTSPTGFFMRFANAANSANIFSVSVTGDIVTTGNANIAGGLLLTGGGLSGTTTWPATFGATPTNIHQVQVGDPITAQIPAGVLQSFVSTVTVPVTYTQAPWPVTNFSGYCDNKNTAASGNSCVPFFSVGLADGGVQTTAYGQNEVISNTDPAHTFSGATFGKDFGALIGNECNPNDWTKAAGATPAGLIKCFEAIGGGNIMPSGLAVGYHVSAFAAGIPWTWGFQTADAAAGTGIELGAVGTGVTQPSQGITLIAHNTSGSSVTATTQAVPNGTTANFNWGVPAAGQFQWLVNSSAQYTLDGTGFFGASVALGTGATGPFIYVNTMAGIPSGVPTDASAGRAALAIDTTNHKICWYEQIGAVWKCALGS